jgi:solute carrier family 25 S-adenosylmethionine transporter 26
MDSCLAGGLAGASVDTILFPLDTIKTRLQSQQGFRAAGGFKNIYSGLSSAVLGSAPSASLFFLTYTSIKSIMGTDTPQVHMLAASCGEVSACLVRVPTDVVKQRMQVGLFSSLSQSARDIYSRQGFFGFYRGFQMTIFREIPFACIQFPFYEKLKQIWKRRDGSLEELASWKAALCGMVSGGTAAALTTPLDVMKTRIMLSTKVIIQCYINKI